MIRRQHPFLFLIAPSILALGWAATAGASAITLQQCLAQLNLCLANLGTCETNFAQAQSDLGTCNTNLTQTQSNLAGCNEGVDKVQFYLAACTADRSQLQADLATCTNDLTDCQANAVAFPASGQTTTFTAEKNDGLTGPVAVPDDGVVQAGASLSYTDNGDGTITDNNTGLMWEKKSDDGGLHDKDNAYYWSGNGTQETIWDWLENVNAEGGTGFAGYHDWRVPNVRELLSIVNYQNTPVAVSAAFNGNCAEGTTVLTGSCTVLTSYGSSTTWARSTGMAWAVDFTHGEVLAHDKTSAFRVRAVRGGTP
jgi:uncharacterized protein DUF1566